MHQIDFKTHHQNHDLLLAIAGQKGDIVFTEGILLDTDLKWSFLYQYVLNVHAKNSSGQFLCVWCHIELYEKWFSVLKGR